MASTSVKLPSKEKSPQKSGLVLMLDALGISSYSLDQSRSFIEDFRHLERELKKSKKNLNFYPFYKDFDFSLFGDTIILCWPLISDNKTKTKMNDLEIFAIVSEHIQIIFNWGLSHKILFRGAISCGDYIVDKNIILGPAIFDANNWCEVTDWFGIICTPKARFWLELKIEELGKKNADLSNAIADYYISYDVPLSKPLDNEKVKNFLTFNPYCQDNSDEPSLQTFLGWINEIPINKENERKITNSVQFFKDVKNLTN
jgi:hypothetical protein